MSAEIDACLVDPPPAERLTATLSYSDDDPYAVRAWFHTRPGQRVEWFFARNILTAGLCGPAGTGDVRAWTDDRRGTASLELRSPRGWAVLEFPAADVNRFLDRTYRLVPLGGETVDVDAWIVGLLQQGDESR